MTRNARKAQVRKAAGKESRKPEQEHEQEVIAPNDCEIVDHVSDIMVGSITYLVHKGRVLAEIIKSDHAKLFYCSGRTYLDLASAIEQERARILSHMFDAAVPAR